MTDEPASGSHDTTWQALKMKEAARKLREEKLAKRLAKEAPEKAEKVRIRIHHSGEDSTRSTV